jgi:excisionase family DNA binding protein
MDERLLKPAEVAQVLQLSLGHTYALMKRGEIPSIRIGTNVRVRRSDLDRYISNKANLNTPADETDPAPAAGQ